MFRRGGKKRWWERCTYNLFIITPKHPPRFLAHLHTTRAAVLMTSMTTPPFNDAGVETPSDADVLAGRGNACNFHPGNEYFRALVRKHKAAYCVCPKSQKGRFSRLIVDEIYARNGRFLKQDATTRLWHDIGDKKALDKTRQALREGAPELLKELQPGQQQQQVSASEYFYLCLSVYNTYSWMDKMV